ncbi:hypothetical protein BDN72DRAFT_523948 [Pluteus cervinus]|uniref:Uncharacterized protein n=1 Tax=Pluteus cervinus TaxID=181527 RepID=A0ACD3A488_9AGAR|nr:hypothetical protein BDN72DRAFT_523948 [Pluteus cervinus]
MLRARPSAPPSRQPEGISAPEPPCPPGVKVPPAWKLNAPLKVPLPSETGPSCWEECYKRVAEYDENMCKAWREEIDKLLLFAGLFSAAVTAFVVESYQWLDRSSDPTAELLAQLISLQFNTTTPVISVAPTGPSASAVRVNVYWFLSLILSLISVLVGVLCLQWLREFQQPVVMSFEEKLRYRQLRYDGLIDWKVPEIITSLSVLLQIALLLFFAGVVDLLWERNHTVAIIILVPITCVVSFLIATSLLPALQAYSAASGPPGITSNLNITQCPYKSPLSWLIHCFFLLLGTGKNRHRDSSFQAAWRNFDSIWRNQDHWGVLAKSIRWMQRAFEHDSATIAPLHECLQILPEAKEVVKHFSGPSRKALQLQHALFPDFPCPDWKDTSSTIICEVACAMQVLNSPAHSVTLLEHWIKLARKDPKFVSFIPAQWNRNIPPELLDEFIGQILSCTLSLMDSREMIKNPFLEHIVRLLQPTVSLPPPYEAIPGRATAVWKVLSDFNPERLPEKAQPYLADLAWTTIKRAGVKLEGSPHHVFWNRYFRTLADETRENDPTLWWLKEFPRPRPKMTLPRHPPHTDPQLLSIDTLLATMPPGRTSGDV